VLRRKKNIKIKIKINFREIFLAEICSKKYIHGPKCIYGFYTHQKVDIGPLIKARIRRKRSGSGSATLD
jgi:hypothetical protein